MNADEIRRLLSEYAAGTISEADRRELMKLACEDQSVFEAVFAEQPLAELMADTATRAELRAALSEPPARGFLGRLWRPWPLAAVATAVVALFAILIGRQVPLPEQRMASKMAESRPTAAPQNAQELPVRAGEADAAKELALRKSEGGKDAEYLLRDRKKYRLDAARKAVALDEAVQAPEVSPPRAPGLAGAELKKEEKPLDPAQALVAQQPIAPPPPGRSRENVSGGVVGGVPGGVVGGVVAPVERQAGRGAVAASAVQSARTTSGQDLAKLAPDGSIGPRYQMWKRTAEGSFAPVSPEAVFHPGDGVQIEIRMETTGYLQAAELLADGTWKVIFPREGVRPVPLAAGTSVRLPEGGALEIGAPPRDRRIVAIVTAAPEPELFRAAVFPRPAGVAVLEILVRTGN